MTPPPADPDLDGFLALLAARRAQGPVVLLYAAKDENRNNAEALRLWLDGRMVSVQV